MNVGKTDFDNEERKTERMNFGGRIKIENEPNEGNTK